MRASATPVASERDERATTAGRRARVRRPAPATVIALLALVFALGGTAVAGTALLNGDRVLQKRSISGNRLRRHTISAAEINMARLGTVPAARHAATADTATSTQHAVHADSAGSAATAATATTAATANAVSAIAYRTQTFTVPGGFTRATATVACDAGSYAVGGGTTSPDESQSSTDLLVDSHPNAARTAWQVTVENDDTAPVQEAAWAVCLSAEAAR